MRGSRGSVWLAILLPVLLLLAAVPAQAAQEVRLEGQIVQGRFLVPMRAIFETLGASVSWDGDTRTVTGETDEVSVLLHIDDTRALVNQERVDLDVPATIVEGRTYVPARFVGESLGAQVFWEHEIRVATIVGRDGTLIKLAQDQDHIPASPTAPRHRLKVQATPDLLPPEGGETSEIQVELLDKEGEPLEGVDVFFAASTYQGEDRSGQLSDEEAVTDASGRAATTYTTRSEDDDLQIEVNVTARDGENGLEDAVYLLASDRGAILEGSVTHPSSGQPLPRAQVSLWDAGAGSMFGEARTGPEGTYRVPVLTSSYHVWFDLDLGYWPLPLDWTQGGSHFELTSTSVWALQHRDIWETGGTYTCNYEPALLRGSLPAASPGQQLALVPVRDGARVYGDTLLVKLADDGAFLAPLEPGTYSVFIRGENQPLLDSVQVEPGKINDLGTIDG